MVVVAILIWNGDVVNAKIVWIEIREQCCGTVRGEVGVDGLGAGWKHCVATVVVTVTVVAVVSFVAVAAAVAVAVAAVTVEQHTVHGAVRLSTLREIFIDGTREGRVFDGSTVSCRVWLKTKLIIAGYSRASVLADEH